MNCDNSCWPPRSRYICFRNIMLHSRLRTKNHFHSAIKYWQRLCWYHYPLWGLSYDIAIHRSLTSIKIAPLSSAITAIGHVTNVICRWPEKVGQLALLSIRKPHSKMKWYCFHLKWWNIFIKLESSVNVTFVKVFVKFGYDQINISYGKGPLKNIWKPSK